MAEPKKPLSLKKALEHMRTGSALLRMNGNTGGPDGANFYIVPGGAVDPHTANAIMKRVDVRGSKDGLFPGHDQTWRFIRDPAPDVPSQADPPFLPPAAA